MLTKEEVMALAKKHRTGLKIQNEIGFGDRKRKAPGIDFYPDYEQFFDPNTYSIHIGCYGVAELFGTKDEAEFLNALNYIRGHEEQHCRSTASVPYTWSVKRGIEKVLEYITEKEKPSKRRFRKDADYEYFANTVLPKMGIYISYKVLADIIGGISNSLEDGRIERIRSDKFAGFEKQRLYHRGIFWEKHQTEFKPYDEVKDNPAEKLDLLLREVLLLSTCQIHTQGFAAMYAETPFWSEMQALKPHIARGVMSGTTRGMAAESIEISSKLAPYIYEACKRSATDSAAKKALEKLLADLIKAMVDQMPEGHNLSEQEEETDEGGTRSTFPHSDLEITLDDETYDKLMRNAKKGEENSSGGLMIFGIYFEEGSLGRSVKRFEDMFEGRDIVACELADVDAQLSQLMERFARSK